MPKQTTVAGGALLARVLDGALKTDYGKIAADCDMKRFGEVFRDADMVETCLCLFENDLNMSKAADNLYMHRNTLLYRINKLKRLTGLDVRTFDDAVTFIILYRCFLRGYNK